MKITLESTVTIVKVNGVQARIWDGQTESGIKIFAMVCKVAVHKDLDSSEFDRELRECQLTYTKGNDYIFDSDF